MKNTPGTENPNPSEQVTPANTDSANTANYTVAATTVNTPAHKQTTQQRMTNFFTGRRPEVHNTIPGNPSPSEKGYD